MHIIKTEHSKSHYITILSPVWSYAHLKTWLLLAMFSKKLAGYHDSNSVTAPIQSRLPPTAHPSTTLNMLYQWWLWQHSTYEPLMRNSTNRVNILTAHSSSSSFPVMKKHLRLSKWTPQRTPALLMNCLYYIYSVFIRPHQLLSSPLPRACKLRPPFFSPPEWAPSRSVSA